MKRTLSILSISLATSLTAMAQQRVTLSGSIQSDVLIPQTDSKIGAIKTDDVQTNTYADLRLQHKYVDAGIRLEYLDHPLPGFEADFKGWGVPHFYVRGKLDWGELTAGTFYEQFGSGFILRTYEERALGIDNSLLGARAVLKPARGIIVKALSGKQRNYWKWNDSWVSGADAEVNLDEWIPSLQVHDTRLLLGASWVNKYERQEDIRPDVTHRLNLPEFTNAFDVRASLVKGAYNLLAEYARKTDEPTYANGYIYRPGQVAMLSASYSERGLSVLLQAKRSENMAFKSRRTANGVSSAINHLPAFTQEHTYALAALYPYATQLADGEWAYQAELGYNFKRKTALGGKYGMNVKVNYSYVRAIDRQFADGQLHNDLGGQMALAGTGGYTSSFFKWGDHTYYQDFDIQLSRKFSKAFKLNLMYMNQRYNQTKIENHPGGMINSNIFVADGKYQFSPKTTLRVEAQWLSTRQDQGDWLYGLAELSLVPHWMLTVSDMWNCEQTKHHYYQALVTYVHGAHRLQGGYVRTRAGFNCSGGVCRYIPAQRGVSLSYNYNF